MHTGAYHITLCMQADVYADSVVGTQMPHLSVCTDAAWQIHTLSCGPGAASVQGLPGWSWQWVTSGGPEGAGLSAPAPGISSMVLIIFLAPPLPRAGEYN